MPYWKSSRCARLDECACVELFDLASAPTVSEGPRRLQDCGEAVLLGLDGLAFIGMSGLRMVLVAAEESSRDGGLFAVTAGSVPVRRLVSLVGLDIRLPLDGCSR